MIVLDTNTTIKLLLERNNRLEDLASSTELIAPEFMKIELYNVLRKYLFLQSMPLNNVYKYISEVKDIIAFFPDAAFLNDAFEISMKLNHPIYDCLFLSLAQNKGAAFASFDKRLLVKASQMGIEVVEFS